MGRVSIDIFWGREKKTSSFSSNRQGRRRRLSFPPPEGRLFVLSGRASLHTFGVEEREGGGMGRFSLSSSLPGPCTYICDPLFGGVGGKHRNRMGGGEEVYFRGGIFSISSGRKAEGKRETKRKRKEKILSSAPFWGNLSSFFPLTG